MRIKIFHPVILFVSAMAVSTILNAADLKVSNNSDYQVSFRIGNECSRELGNIENNTITTIPEASLKKVCGKAPDSCELEVYNAPDCKGKSVGTVTLDLKKGLQKIVSSPKNGKPALNVGISIFSLFFQEPCV